MFFARIMKEHSLFLEAGFTPVCSDFAKRAESFKNEFERLLSCAVGHGDGIVTKDIISSKELITEFTDRAERQTARLTGIKINSDITCRESRLTGTESPCISDSLVRSVRGLNQTAMRRLNGLIDFKQEILSNVLCCRMFTVNYPLLIEHIIREAKLYRTCVTQLESGDNCLCQTLRQTERFWNQIMMEHAMFIRGLLDPAENDLIKASDSFACDYAQLLNKSREANDATMIKASLEKTKEFRDFKAAGAKGIQNCEIRSIILPLLADHVLREANHYIRMLGEEE